MKATVIAVRELICTAEPGRGLTVTLYKPVPNRKTGDCMCSFQINGRGLSRNRFAAGVDAFQALQLALLMIGAEIAQIERASGIHLIFGDLQNSGFRSDGHSGT